ncbi:MAG: hypothetical protein SGARI_000006 [Bacillariaceae sp.]
MNATTLRLLQNCKLANLSLVGSRNVTDDWLKPLSASSVTTDTTKDYHDDEGKDAIMQGMDESCTVVFSASFEESLHPKGSASSNSSFLTASSTHLPPPAAASNAMVPESLSRASAHTNGDVDMSISSSFEDCKPYHDTATYSQPSLANTATSCMKLLDLRGSNKLTDKGLMQLSDLSSLEVAKLDGCFALQGRGLLAFSNSHCLQSLSLANCRRLTDEAVINISHLTSLEALSLDGCRCLTDRSMQAISSLYHLKQIDLSQCDLITDAGLKYLNNLEWIEELSLGWCRSISDAGIRVLCSQMGRASHFRVLNLARVDISDDGVEHLTKLHALEELGLNGCTRINSSNLGAVLATLPHLTSLDVSYCPGIL